MSTESPLGIPSKEIPVDGSHDCLGENELLKMEGDGPRNLTAAASGISTHNVANVSGLTNRNAIHAAAVQNLILTCGDAVPPLQSFGVYADFVSLIEHVTEILQREPRVLRLDPSNVIVVGDVHGCFKDTMAALRRGFIFDQDDTGCYLFLGDYIDKGSEQVEVLWCLLALKVLFPERIFLLRGDHEQGGTWRDCFKDRFEEKLMEAFPPPHPPNTVAPEQARIILFGANSNQMGLFPELPLCAMIGGVLPALYQTCWDVFCQNTAGSHFLSPHVRSHMLHACGDRRSA